MCARLVLIAASLLTLLGCSRCREETRTTPWTQSDYETLAQQREEQVADLERLLSEERAASSRKDQLLSEQDQKLNPGHAERVGAMQEIDRQAERAVVSITCPDGRTWGPSCGTVSEYLLGVFLEKNPWCKAVMDANCRDQFLDKLMLKWKERYPAARWGWVFSDCTRSESSCDILLLEARALLSHNTGIKEWAGAEKQKVQQAAEPQQENLPERFRPQEGDIRL